MKSLCKTIACLLVLPTIWLFLPNAALGSGKVLLARAYKKTITVHAPKVMASSEESVTLEQAPKGKKKTNWLLIGLAAAVVVGLAAAIGGSGGGGGSGGDNDTQQQDEEGDITVGW